jgi:hypothetical protein
MVPKKKNRTNAANVILLKFSVVRVRTPCARAACDTPTLYLRLDHIRRSVSCVALTTKLNIIRATTPEPIPRVRRAPAARRSAPASCSAPWPQYHGEATAPRVRAARAERADTCFSGLQSSRCVLRAAPVLRAHSGFDAPRAPAPRFRRPAGVRHGERRGPRYVPVDAVGGRHPCGVPGGRGLWTAAPGAWACAAAGSSNACSSAASRQAPRRCGSGRRRWRGCQEAACGELHARGTLFPGRAPGDENGGSRYSGAGIDFFFVCARVRARADALRASGGVF